jgi:SAM-dependent methyltransferase
VGGKTKKKKKTRNTLHVSQTMIRCVKPELLDDLPPADARALRSREDLVRVNAWMGNCGTMAAALRATCNGRADRRIVELGAGDGRFLLGVARRLPAGWRGTRALLLDRMKAAPPRTCQGFSALGWQAEILEAEALDWLARADAPACDAMLANLFLHHFPDAQLEALLSAAARRTRVFIAVEPRRSRGNLVLSRLLWFIGCNGVTRHDGPVSVRAGFAGHDLSRLWPAGPDWVLEERPAGWSSHLFIARQRG